MRLSETRREFLLSHGAGRPRFDGLASLCAEVKTAPWKLDPKLVARPAVDRLSHQVQMTSVSGRLFEHVDQDPSQADTLSKLRRLSAERIQRRRLGYDPPGVIDLGSVEGQDRVNGVVAI